jgi:2-polyprenyl-3-methyl-5-hydroxy-6-metoxy-1,4-benzoquinol methylase
MIKTDSEKHFDKIAVGYDSGKSKYSYYYESLKNLLGSLIPHGKSVYEIGCGTGDLLASLKPKYGYGMDISEQMIEIAKDKYKRSLASQGPGKKSKNLYFSTRWPKEKFDYIFMSDVIEHLEYPEETFWKLRKLMDKETIFICTMANPIWEPVLMFAEKLELKMPEGPHIRLSTDNLKLIIKNSKLRLIKHDYTLLMPIKIPIITHLANKYLEKHLKTLAFIEYFVVKAA